MIIDRIKEAVTQAYESRALPPRYQADHDLQMARHLDSVVDLDTDLDEDAHALMESIVEHPRWWTELSAAEKRTFQRLKAIGFLRRGRAYNSRKLLVMTDDNGYWWMCRRVVYK